MARVRLFLWNPRTPLGAGPIKRRLPLGPRYNNFGDLLGPIVANAMAERSGVDLSQPVRSGRLVTVGSVMHLTRTGDTIWGAGVNGQHLGIHPPITLDVRAVRGPRTREYLELHGIRAPAIYGDPALLLDLARPDLVARPKRHAVTLFYNMRDLPVVEWDAIPRGVNVVDARSALEACLTAIAESELVIGTALHAIIVAEALGVPARVVRPPIEPSLKYHDYFEGTGRLYAPAAGVQSAIGGGGQEGPCWDRESLEAAFPADLWCPQPLR